ncbi:conserved hypothetical protein [Aspergillus terreus NIH2624]|uniref:DUF4604 domain-containing protein n=1 Tax=Aspergillus terreus (strain NIH 2624 / FGSC A1156) TaxID=341663 RepID=Q0CJH8_ASPTN|nr:uncharacterized protein ATEG_06156 [Aspergillus terreus NIH2624]EAU33917.1 conserved hypothetical protein [Aspergillus terreus NIH2624]
MSFKAKNLSYDAKEPAFLQRLRNQYGNNTGRLERPMTRPRKPKDANVDDDEPTYVDEETNEVISKEEYEALVRAEETSKEGPAEDGETPSRVDQDGKSTTEKEAPASKQAIAEIGGPKKRKQAKVVGDDHPPEESEDLPRKDAGSRKPKQKKKKIKLSFDEEA